MTDGSCILGVGASFALPSTKNFAKRLPLTMPGSVTSFQFDSWDGAVRGCDRLKGAASRCSSNGENVVLSAMSSGGRAPPRVSV